MSGCDIKTENGKRYEVSNDKIYEKKESFLGLITTTKLVGKANNCNSAMKLIESDSNSKINEIKEK